MNSDGSSLASRHFSRQLPETTVESIVGIESRTRLGTLRSPFIVISLIHRCRNPYHHHDDDEDEMIHGDDVISRACSYRRGWCLGRRIMKSSEKKKRESRLTVAAGKIRFFRMRCSRVALHAFFISPASWKMTQVAS